MKTTCIGIGLLLLGIGAMSCQSSKADKTEDEANARQSKLTLTNDQLTTGGITVGLLSERTFASTFQVRGKVEVPPQNRVSISPPMGGYLYRTPLLPGMRVKKGQAIAVLEDRTYIDLLESFQSAQNKLAWLTTEFQRQKELAESKAVSDKIFQETQYQLSQQKILVQSLGEKLRLVGIDPTHNPGITRFLTIKSPINGIVSVVYGNVGKYVQPTDVLFDLIEPTDIHLSLHVFEQDMERLYVGQSFQAFTNSKPDRFYSGKVLIISPIYSEDKTVNVQCHFDQPMEGMAPGTYMNVILAQPARKSWSLPAEAVVQRGSQNWIYRELAPGSFERVLVRIGTEKEGWIPIELPAGIRPRSSQWVLSGAYALYMMEENRD